MNFHRTRLAPLLIGLWLALFSRGAFAALEAESPAFVLDTLTPYSTASAESAAFELNTLTPGAMSVAVSSSFVLDTRMPGGSSGSWSSSGFVLDTRFAVATGLTIVGPSSVASGSRTEYRVVMNQPGGGTTDVRELAQFGFDGLIPTWAAIGGTTLFVNRSAPTATLRLQARYQNAAGQVVSATFAVTINPAFHAGMAATAQYVSGSNYTITLDGRVSGGVPPFTFRWDTNGDGMYGEAVGQHSTAAASSTGGKQVLGLEVTDGIGAKAYARGAVEFAKPPVAREPVFTKPTWDVGSGAVYGTDGHPFTFRSDRTQNGFVVITHGIYANGLDPWLRDMGQRIETRLTNDAQGRVPNIAIYDWHKDSDPSGQVNPYALASLEILSAVGFAGKLVTAAKVGAEAVAKVVIKKWVEDFVKSKGEELSGIPLDARFFALAGDFIVDAVFIRYIAQSHGAILASWIWGQAKDGLIDVDKPVHLIGDSAGGFVVGECALWLKQHPLPNGKIVVVDRVTMLDTPFPMRSHLTALPSAPYATTVERFVSSLYGELLMPSAYNVLVE